ncbi:hypothetical protein NDU88_007563 [Pleurodeles waltl]|uniref:Retrotransposon gag domain-containing protein n=1 Tax=Pleurodeles waltl TaxID=8319 RepID=A0AAV7QQ81_PLEWA|nr:hypothetical protein NDU88_007563 [Pleurodeles waltl]
MASGNAWNLTAPEPFMPKNGEATLKWEEWSEYFINYISTFEDEEELTPEKKKKILLHCLGAKGLKMYNSINKKTRAPDQGDVFSHALEDLTEYFRPAVCVAVDRFKFYHRKQQLEESVENYVAALKNLALSCKFGNLHDDLIRDQIIMHTANPHIQEKLWSRGEASLREVIDLVKSAELTGRNVNSDLFGKEGEEITPERKECNFDWLDDLKNSPSEDPDRILNEQPTVSMPMVCNQLVLPARKTSKCGRLVKMPREDVLQCSCTAYADLCCHWARASLRERDSNVWREETVDWGEDAYLGLSCLSGRFIYE